MKYRRCGGGNTRTAIESEKADGRVTLPTSAPMFVSLFRGWDLFFWSPVAAPPAFPPSNYWRATGRHFRNCCSRVLDVVSLAAIIWARLNSIPFRIV
ncbi:hypothetical protein EVAR_55930_1 [Eumeta japonica]|uniref:Uncharacterized protein n=1 Tax=Eumeta variegata TaxID=151549 RepID=A0A4C1YYU0_EUMVA|nr:hypothetical protein EVAR_55930_1 [Eumeta japonica]